MCLFSISSLFFFFSSVFFKLINPDQIQSKTRYFPTNPRIPLRKMRNALLLINRQIPTKTPPTVPFRSIRQSQVTGLAAGPKCHKSHRLQPAVPKFPAKIRDFGSPKHKNPAQNCRNLSCVTSSLATAEILFRTAGHRSQVLPD